MRTLVLYLPALGCAAVMFVCMRMMGRDRDATPTNDTTREVEQLREEVARLRTELDDATRKARIDG